jgi:hypothetical protein
MTFTFKAATASQYLSRGASALRIDCQFAIAAVSEGRMLSLTLDFALEQAKHAFLRTCGKGRWLAASSTRPEIL